MNIKMLKPNTFIKATTATLATCMLMACGGESSDTDIISAKTHTMTLTPSSMGASQGKSTFTLNVKDADGFAVNAVVPMMMPMMTMSEAKGGHQHSTPHTGCSATDIDGNAECTVYFSMASKMESGAAMGTWNLGFTLPDSNQAAVEFTPNVAMAMGSDDTLVKLKGVDDMIAGMEMDGMTMPTPREYQVYNNGLTGTENDRSIELFIAAKETMMSYPALVQNIVLNDGSADYELTAALIDVRVSTDNQNWITATTEGNGLWQATGISGIQDNMEATIYVSLSVEAEAKVANGNTFAEIKINKPADDMSAMNGAM